VNMKTTKGTANLLVVLIGIKMRRVKTDMHRQREDIRAVRIAYSSLGRGPCRFTRSSFSLVSVLEINVGVIMITFLL